MRKIDQFVSIGLPVYNGETLIRRSIDSLLNQTHRNFELILSDNGSNDNTAFICKEYQKKDSRIVFLPSDKNHGVNWNFNRVFENSKSEYYMWASHDDIWSPTFIEECLKGFETSKNVVLSAASCESVRENGDVEFVDSGLNLSGLNSVDRFKSYKSSLHNGSNVNSIFYGIYLKKFLKEILPMKKLIANDHLMLAELSLQGEFITSLNILLKKSWGGASLSHAHNARAQGITNSFSIKCPYLVREWELQKIIFKHSDSNIFEKIKLSVWSLNHYVYLGMRFFYRKLFSSIDL